MTICYYTETDDQWSREKLADKLFLLPKTLQKQALRKRQWVDKQLSIAGKLLLLKVLNEFKSPFTLADLQYNTYHRPYLDAGFDFNIAHSGNIVVCCATDTGHIGIDVEEVKEINLADFTDYFTANEWGKINSYQNKYDGFYDFWTRKEAVLKAIGSGFHTPLSTIDVSDDSMVYDDTRYYIHSLLIDRNYKCHIAATQIIDHISVIKVDF